MLKHRFCLFLSVLLILITFNLSFADENNYIAFTGEGFEHTLSNNGSNDFNGNFSYLGETKTFPVSIDFSTTTTAAFALIRNGNNDTSMEIKDSSDNILGSGNVSRFRTHDYVFIDRPNPQTTSATLKVTVKCLSYNDNNSYLVTVGKKDALEEIVKGDGRAVYLENYTEQKGNYFQSKYVPNI